MPLNLAEETGRLNLVEVANSPKALEMAGFAMAISAQPVPSGTKGARRRSPRWAPEGEPGTLAPPCPP